MKKSPDSFLDSMRSSIQDRRGISGAFMASDFSKYQWGVKIPHLMMEYLVGLNVIPMPTIIELAGMPGSCKSAFLQYLMSIYAKADMMAMMLETEGKMSNTLLDSFLREYADRVLIDIGPMSQEQWMAELLNALKNYRKAYSDALDKYLSGKKKDIELLTPFLVGLDSLGGAASEETIETTDRDKSVGRSYPIEALKNSRFFSQLPVRMRDLPMTLVYTNHEQTRLTEQKGPFAVQAPRSSQGGKRPEYYCGLRVFFECTDKPKTTQHVTSQKVVMEVTKNSFSEKSQKFSVPMCWKVEIDPETGANRQLTWFNWVKALTDFLAPSSGDAKYEKSEVKKFLNVERHSETSFSCRELGLSKVSPEEIGAAIEADQDLVARLRPWLGIKTWRVWDGKPLIEKVTAELDMEDPDLNVSEAEVQEAEEVVETT